MVNVRVQIRRSDNAVKRGAKPEGNWAQDQKKADENCDQAQVLGEEIFWSTIRGGINDPT